MTAVALLGFDLFLLLPKAVTALCPELPRAVAALCPELTKALAALCPELPKAAANFGKKLVLEFLGCSLDLSKAISNGVLVRKLASIARSNILDSF